MQTPGDRLLARLLASSGSRPLPLADLARLLDAVQGRIQVASAAESHAARLQVRLPQLGAVEVQVLHGHGQLQIEISASPGSLALLQQARGELLERLQRLHPEQPVQLTFNQQQDSGQRSRQRRYLHEEWQAE
ncbi:type III secretion system needle length determinant [Pseudomonas aeruginosa MSH-10]|jgi:type III secretion protein P|nr:type III secretion system needle length determinant [Pseudomonas aeruginosa PAO581]AGY64369.1 type III secretion system needle length determinant [Pseudomonas aeruginosa PAO1-VE2]AGY73143.1 type III secretion system needle length determinant [Pseudomonas aeruginosa PAO1-VE13]AKG00021.1 translocation protein in type III secretion [Pseudomonas aeruginosa]EHS34220.1 translocation protein in type III secretion [Pseudomonas aeruginosa MPAO1/P1]EHS37679.1 translocation protein in type III secreti